MCVFVCLSMKGKGTQKGQIQREKMEEIKRRLEMKREIREEVENTGMREKEER